MSTTTKAKRKGKTPEQRAADLAALHAQFTAQVQELATSEGWLRWLRFAQSFHAYSLRNTLLILDQCPEATYVAGYRKWREQGRQVRKGEKGIKILGYSTKKITETNPETGEEEDRYVPRFPVLTVFDVSQTEGEALPERPGQRLTGQDEQGIGADVLHWLEQEGWQTAHEEIPGEVNGYTHFGDRRVVIERTLSPRQAAKTALHEAAHVLLHDDPKVRETLPREVREVEAESVAFIVAGALGLDTADYSVGYVTGWGRGDLEVLQGTAGRVLGVAQVLLAALEASGHRV